LPKPKPLVNGNSLKNSTKLEPKEKKKKKPTVNGISNTDTSESLVSIRLDMSQEVGGTLLDVGMVGAIAIIHRERSGSGPVNWTTRELITNMSDFGVELKFGVVVDRLPIPRQTR